MAMLNYASLLTNELKTTYLGTTASLENKLKLIFTGDKHIITHGVDFLSDYNNGTRGLVPNYSLGVDANGIPITADVNGVLGKEGWKKITTSMLPIASALTDNTTTSIFNAQQVRQLIGDGFAANDAMLFKGVVESINNLPKSSYSAGWTYRAKSDFTLTLGTGTETKTVTVSAGDLIIAINDSVENQNTFNPNHWAVVENNINGTQNVRIGNDVYTFYTTSPSSTEINVAEKLGINNLGISKNTDGTLILNYTGTNDVIVGKTLMFGAGFNTGFYNGTSDITLNLAAATDSTVGGIIYAKVSSSHSVVSLTTTLNANIDASTNGRYYGIQRDSNGKAFVYVPWINTTYDTVSSTASGLAPQIIEPNSSITNINDEWVLASTNGGTPTWRKLPAGSFSNDTWRSIKLYNVSTNLADEILGSAIETGALTFKKGQGINITNNSGTLTFAITSAKTNELGGIVVSNKIDTSVNLTSADGTVENRYYGVQVDKDGKAFVNVPWRNITVGGNSIGNQTLNFTTPKNGSIGIIAGDLDDTNTGVYDIGFDIFWYNLNTSSYELPNS